MSVVILYWLREEYIILHLDKEDTVLLFPVNAVFRNKSGCFESNINLLRVETYSDEYAAG